MTLLDDLTPKTALEYHKNTGFSIQLFQKNDPVYIHIYLTSVVTSRPRACVNGLGLVTSDMGAGSTGSEILVPACCIVLPRQQRERRGLMFDMRRFYLSEILEKNYIHTFQIIFNAT